MGEALDGGHEMLNHLGKVIRVTRKTIRSLDKRNYLRRDRRSGLLQLRPEFYPLFRELERGGCPVCSSCSFTLPSTKSGSGTSKSKSP
jgi:hypothetical protein